MPVPLNRYTTASFNDTLTFHRSKMKDITDLMHD